MSLSPFLVLRVKNTSSYLVLGNVSITQCKVCLPLMMTHHINFLILLWSDYTAWLVKIWENDIFFQCWFLFWPQVCRLHFNCHSIEAKLLSDSAKYICFLSIEVIVISIPWPTAQPEVDITWAIYLCYFVLHLLLKQSCTGIINISTFSGIISLPQNWLFLYLIWSQVFLLFSFSSYKLQSLTSPR